ncbi:HAD family hydrolase [Deinococcus ruber]|uniref:Hydrolase n=1 Tax=Deinococcus ruber TaxID=1848197 RepID=A0A918BZ63_9DEIO|nr:HAD family phosphatase [Deinococcus ruber]GGQ99231.1 hydrolase [Deinococcus ruber]
MSVQNGRVKGVLFDRDETIAYTDPGVYREAAVWAAERFGLEPGAVGAALKAQWAASEGWWHLRTEADEELFWQSYGQELAGRFGVPPEHIGPMLTEWPYQRYMKPVPSARDVLSALKARGLKVGVLSNTMPSIGITLEAVELHDLIDVAIATCTLGVHKPQPEAFTLAAELMELAPSELLFVDDKQENVDAARSVGMQAVLIDLRGQHPEAIHDLRAVLELV